MGTTAIQEKGNVTVVIDLEDNNNEMETILHDPVYVPISTDPTM